MSDEKHDSNRYKLELLDAQVALFQWSGPISLEDRKQNVRRMVQFCETHGVKKLIIDGRNQLSQTGTLDSYDFGSEVPVEMRGLRIAVVYRPDDDSLKFIETVANNRGARTRAFRDIDEARKWLDEPPASKQP